MMSRPLALPALVCATVGVLVGSALPHASAHPSVRDYIQHRAVIAVGASDIEVTLDLTFHEHASARERGCMDADAERPRRAAAVVR